MSKRNHRRPHNLKTMAVMWILGISCNATKELTVWEKINNDDDHGIRCWLVKINDNLMLWGIGSWNQDFNRYLMIHLTDVSTESQK